MPIVLTKQFTFSALLALARPLPSLAGARCMARFLLIDPRAQYKPTGYRSIRSGGESPPLLSRCDTLPIMRILVVEDDSLLAVGLVRTLTRTAHSVDHATTGIEADLTLRKSNYDLVVLDIGLPGLDGFEVLRRLRRRDSTVSVLMLTARDAVEDRVKGLDMGADDYRTKPFSLNELEARVRVLLRRITLPTLKLEVGHLTIDFAARRVKVDRNPVELSLREWALLELFLSRPGRVLSKEQLVQHLFSQSDQVALNTIEVYVSRLRAKIESGGVRIRTVRGFGYLWESEDA